MIRRNYGITWFSTNLTLYKLDFEMLELMKQSGCEEIDISIEFGQFLSRIGAEVVFPQKAADTRLNFAKFIRSRTECMSNAAVVARRG